MSKFTKFIYKLEKRGIITRKPRPSGVFILAIIYLMFTFIAYFTHKKLHTLPLSVLIYIMMVLTIFTFIFAILHWIVVRTVEKQEKRLGIKPKESKKTKSKELSKLPIQK